MESIYLCRFISSRLLFSLLQQVSPGINLVSRVGLEPGLDLVSLPPGGGPQLGLETAHVAGDVGQPLPGQPPQAALYQGQAPVRGLVSGAFRLGISVIFLEFWALNFSIIFSFSENLDNNTLSQNLILLPRFRK